MNYNIIMVIKVSFRNNWLRGLATYLVIFILVVLVSYFFFYHFKLLYTDIDSARYVLSALIESEATILAIVITLSLVAVQLAASSSSRVIDMFKRTPDLWILIVVYIFSIAYCLTLLKLVINTQNRISDLESYILFAYYISMFAFIALIPYMWNVLDLMKPSVVIDKLTERITEKNVLTAASADGKLIEKDDPIQPIVDIMNASLMKYDYGTFREGLRAIWNSTINILDKNLDKNEKENIINHVLYHLETVKGLSAESDEGRLVDEVIADIKRYN